MNVNPVTLLWLAIATLVGVEIDNFSWGVTFALAAAAAIQLLTIRAVRQYHAQVAETEAKFDALADDARQYAERL